jgi:hypothetical protein
VLTELFSREWPEDSAPVVKPHPGAVMPKLSAILAPESGEDRAGKMLDEDGAAEIRNIQPAAEILDEMTREAEQILSRYNPLVAVA